MRLREQLFLVFKRAVTPAGTTREDSPQGQVYDLDSLASGKTAAGSLFVSSDGKVACKCTSVSVILGEDRFYPEACVCFTDFGLAERGSELKFTVISPRSPSAYI